MTDKQLSDLFAAGTAPERDPAFALRVEVEIRRARLRMRILALTQRTATTLLLAVIIFVSLRLVEYALTPLLERMPQFMGVPVPMVLCVLVAGLVLRTRLHLPFRRFTPPRA